MVENVDYFAHNILYNFMWILWCNMLSWEFLSVYIHEAGESFGEKRF